MCLWIQVTGASGFIGPAIGMMTSATARRALWDRIGRELVVSLANLEKAGRAPRIETKAGLRAMVTAARAGAIER